MATHPVERRTPVAQYLRMSTEHQRYSTTNQREQIDKYVAEHDMEVVRTYEDSGKSGLTLTERPALQELLADVHSPERRFQAVVVFDVSRWGRFQEVDESAYYEFVCRRVKRAMAAEYSRELGARARLQSDSVDTDGNVVVSEYLASSNREYRELHGRVLPI